MKRFNLHRSIIVTLILGGAAAFGSPARAQFLPPKLKIGTVNLQQIVESSSDFQKAQSQIQKDVESWQSEHDKFVEQMQKVEATINDKEESLQAQASLLKEDKKAARQAEIDSLKLDLQEKIAGQANMEQERGRKRQEELLNAVLEKVLKKITEMGEDGGYDLIYDATKGTILFTHDKVDLTDQLAKKMKGK